MVPSSTVASDKINIVTEDAEPTRRQRILRAAMGLFVARGYAGTSTLAIASAARVSKRDLYAEFAGKREILAACVQSRSLAMTARLDAPVPFDRAGLASVLIAYGTGVRMGMQEPARLV